jgi:hypothetical protein
MIKFLTSLILFAALVFSVVKFENCSAGECVSDNIVETCFSCDHCNHISIIQTDFSFKAEILFNKNLLSYAEKILSEQSKPLLLLRPPIT